MEILQRCDHEICHQIFITVAAAAADDEGDAERTARQAFQAFQHQLNAVQYAEIAVMDNDGLDDDTDSL